MKMTQMQAERTRKVTGHGRYTADEWRTDGRFEGAAAAVFVRSPHAAARISGIDTEAAAEMPGVLRILTGQDCIDAGFQNFPVLSRWGAIPAPHRPSLAHDSVHHVGEAVALVIAETHAQALDAAEAVLVDYESLPATIGIAAALAADACAVHASVPDNVVFTHVAGDAAATARAMADAALVVETEIELPRLAPGIMEPRAAVAQFNAATGEYWLRTPHQGVNEIRRDLAAVLGIPAERFQVLPGDVGGGFGPRNSVYPDLPPLLLAARLTGRAVAWAGTRSESFLTDLQGRGVRVRGRLALDAAGHFTALEMQYDADLGAYVSPVAVIAHGLLCHPHSPRRLPPAADQRRPHRPLPRRRTPRDGFAGRATRRPRSRETWRRSLRLARPQRGAEAGIPLHAAQRRPIRQRRFPRYARHRA